MTPEDAARIHAEAFPQAPWPAPEIARLACAPGFMVATEQGFALGRCAAGEAELLTIATAPAARRRGQGRALLALFDQAAQDRGATEAFLEVAADNSAARALYAQCGWRQVAIRTGYYRAPDGTRRDAILLKRPFMTK